MRQRGECTTRGVRAAAAALACGVVLFLVPAALADLSPPTAAPHLAKRTCARYGVAATPSGPAARCLAHTDSTLRAPRNHRSQAATGSPMAARRTEASRAASRAAQDGGHSGAVAAAQPTRAAGLPAPGQRAGQGSGAGISTALAAALASVAALLALALLGLLTRRRRREMHAAPS